MRILHISRTMGQGGAEKVVLQLCLDGSKHEMYIASCGGQHVAQLNENGVSHLLIPDIDKKNPWLMIKTFALLCRFIRQKKIDIVHTHHRMAAFYTRLLLVLFPDLKHVYTAHNIFNDKPALMRFSLSRAKVVAVGEGVRQNLLNRYRIPAQQISIIYNAVKGKEGSHPHPALLQEKQEGAYLIGNIGRISRQKGMDVFLHAMKEILSQDSRVKAVIIGDGEDMNAMKGLAKDLGIAQSVLFLGYQNHVLDIIEQLDFVVLSSRWEGFPLTPIEVFSTGKTIIASDIPGTNEIVKDGENGLLFSMENAEQLAERICFLMQNEDVKAKLEKGALATYKKEFSYASFLENYNRIYEEE